MIHIILLYNKDKNENHNFNLTKNEWQTLNQLLCQSMDIQQSFIQFSKNKVCRQDTLKEIKSIINSLNKLNFKYLGSKK